MELIFSVLKVLVSLKTMRKLAMSVNATEIYNLAGKYRAQFGTPFDLEELTGITGLDVNNVTHVKIIDVVGSLNESYASYDSQGNIINDPFPTPFRYWWF